MLDHSFGIQVTDKLFEMADRAMHDHCSFVLETSESWVYKLGLSQDVL